MVVLGGGQFLMGEVPLYMNKGPCSLSTPPLSDWQKEHQVKGDPYIECLERPVPCWHPPLVAVSQV